MQNLSLLRFNKCAWLYRTNAPEVRNSLPLGADSPYQGADSPCQGEMATEGSQKG